MSEFSSKSGLGFKTSATEIQLICDNQASLGELFDAACAFKSHIIKLMEENKIKENEKSEEKKENDES